MNIYFSHFGVHQDYIYKMKMKMKKYKGKRKGKEKIPNN